MNGKYLLTVLLITIVLAFAQTTKISGVNPAILDTGTTVLARVTVSDVYAFASQWKATPKIETVRVLGKEVKVAVVSVDGLELRGRLDGASATLYYKGPASALKSVVDSPHVQLIFVKVTPEIPPRDFFKDVSSLLEREEGAPQPTLPVMREIIGASRVEQLFGVSGTGVVIAVVDTGVGYGHPGLKTPWLGSLKPQTAERS